MSRRGSHRVNDASQIKKLNEFKLRALIDQKSQDILKALNRTKGGIDDFLHAQSYSVQDAEVAIELIVRACKCRNPGEVAKLLRTIETHKDSFIVTAIPNVIHKALTKECEIDLSKLMLNFMIILKHMLKKIKAFEIVLDAFPQMQNYINRMRVLNFVNIAEVTVEYHCLEEEVEKYEKSLARQKAIDQQPPEDFRELSVVPSKNDVLNFEIPFLRPNIIEGGYDSVQHYLDIHFRLMREDMIRSFRNSVSEYKCKKTNEPHQFSSARMYKDVLVHLPPEYTCNGILYKTFVKTPNPINWAAKKILLPGTLVCLTFDQLKTVIFATVKIFEPESEYSKQCMLKIHPEHPDDELYADKLYTMFETDAYFEPYRHILSSMKEHTEESFPLSDCIVYLNNEETDAEDFENISFCLHESCSSSNLANVATDTDHTCKLFNVLNPEEWPTAEELKLDKYQHKAFQTALTKKLSLIQGPPGTGKTFLGIKIVKALLENTTKRPIIISCLTNHALDQFLELALLHTKKVIRLGLQSKSEILRPHVLNNILQVTKEYNNAQPCENYRVSDLVNIETMKIIKLLVKEVPALERSNNYRFVEMLTLCKKINHSLFLLEKVKKMYFDDGILNLMVNLDYKSVLLKGACTSATTLSKNMKEWLCFSKSDDVYQRCENVWIKHNKSYEFDGPVEDEESYDSTDHMAEECSNIWSIPTEKRFDLFFEWRKTFARKLKQDIKKQKMSFKIEFPLLNEPIDNIKLDFLKNADIIGMTTTGGAKYRDWIRSVRPTIMIVEEAAEVLESHIISSLVPSIEHLILIGDHAQLRPLPADHELAVDYNLNISLFERLFNNKAPSATLCSQHRMRPCISELLVPCIYKTLLSDKSVFEYEDIQGTKSNMFFVQHVIAEDSLVTGKSYSNKYEAEFIAKLCQYLICQGYDYSQITVLSTYGQQISVINECLGIKLKDIFVTTVDNYQGEENDIILISFVRNNCFDNIGFLKDSNRLCVALSRARKALFCFGNFESYARKNTLWASVVAKLKDNDMIGKAFPLKCKNHPEEIGFIKQPADFDAYVLGGCLKECGYKLPCEHICSKQCHYEDPQHIQFKCQEPCGRMINSISGLKLCKKRCWQICETKKKSYINLRCGHKVGNCYGILAIFESYKCNVEFQKRLSCGHFDTLPCHVSVSTYQCKASVHVTLACGHKISVPCYKKHSLGQFLCQEVQIHTAPCGHTVEVPCHINPDADILVSYCKKSCESILNCGHPCTGYCSWCFGTKIHSLCRFTCDLKLPCGHKCTGFCGTPCSPCSSKCMISCSHSYCVNLCSRPCVKCENPCTWQCDHGKCEKVCWMDCDNKPCNEFCKETLNCGHPCIGFCGEPCPILCGICDKHELNLEDPESDRFIMLEDCDHIIEVKKLTLHIEEMVESFEWPVCPVCLKPIAKSIRYYKFLKRAKDNVLQGVDCSEKIQELFFRLRTMFGESCLIKAGFHDVYCEMKVILEHEKLDISILAVLEPCILALKELVIISEMLTNANYCKEAEELEDQLYRFVSWIHNHLRLASYQQLYEFDNAILTLKNKVKLII